MPILGDDLRQFKVGLGIEKDVMQRAGRTTSMCMNLYSVWVVKADASLVQVYMKSIVDNLASGNCLPDDFERVEIVHCLPDLRP